MTGSVCLCPRADIYHRCRRGILVRLAGLARLGRCRGARGVHLRNHFGYRRALLHLHISGDDSDCRRGQGNGTSVNNRFASLYAREIFIGYGVNSATITGGYRAKFLLDTTLASGSAPDTQYGTIFALYDASYLQPANLAAAAGIFTGVDGIGCRLAARDDHLESHGNPGRASSGCSFTGTAVPRRNCERVRSDDHIQRAGRASLARQCSPASPVTTRRVGNFMRRHLMQHRPMDFYFQVESDREWPVGRRVRLNAWLGVTVRSTKFDHGFLQAPRALDEPLCVAVGRYFHPQAIDKRAILPHARAASNASTIAVARALVHRCSA